MQGRYGCRKIFIEMKHSGIILALLIAMSLVSCKTEYDILLESNDVDAKYAAAFDYYNKWKFNKAAQLFESLSFLAGGTERDDTVQFYWGLSNYMDRDYYTAQSNLERFVTNFPRSTFTEYASFLRLDCLYRSTLRYELDQTPTYTCMTAINQFLIDYPQTERRGNCELMLDDLEERLDKKALENAKLYYKMEDYKASRVAFRNILKDDADNRYREDILYYTAMSSYHFAALSVPDKQKERFLVFVDDYLNFIEEYEESGYRKELDALYRKVRKNYETSDTVTPVI